MSGEIDYLPKIVARDIADRDRIHRKPTKIAPLHDVSSSSPCRKSNRMTALPPFG
jgi:Lrp/AsnC family transcriptional regulator